MKKPLVSVIVPCYNHAKYLPFCINSILNQTFQDFEIVIVDDASTDDSLKVARSFKDKRIRVCTNKINLGCIKSGNVGFRKSKGAYINLFSADDGMLPKNLEKKVKILENNPGVGMVFSESRFIDSEGKKIRDTKFRPGRGYIGRDDYSYFLRYGSFIMSSSMLTKRELFNSQWAQDEKIPLAAEWQMQLNICKNCKTAYLAEPLVYFRVHGSNLSKNTDINRFEEEFLYSINTHLKENPSKKAERLLLGQLYYSLYRAYYAQGEPILALNHLLKSLRHSGCFLLHLKNRFIGK